MHHPSYREQFAGNLRRGLPRIPIVSEWQTFREIGEQLKNIHLHYNQLEPYKLRTAELPLQEPDDKRLALTGHMRFGGKAGNYDKRVLVYNAHLTYNNIPEEAIRHQVGGKSLLEWVMDRYNPDNKDKDSGISNAPTMSGSEIHRLIGQAIAVGVETTRLVNQLPDFNIKKKLMAYRMNDG